MRQLLLNLVTNAGEAQNEEGGEVRIRTGVLDLERSRLARAELGAHLAPGPYVFLEVSDTGCGMDAATRARLFMPFYSTKFTGRGLGLAAVLGIVRGHRGAIEVETAPGKGTTIRVLLPPSGKKTARLAVPAASPAAAAGTVLVIEDEASVRRVVQIMLEGAGFRVLTAKDGIEGLEVFRQNIQEVSVVLLDFTMPGMGGQETFHQLRRLRADVPVILASGYSEEDATGQFAGLGLAGFIAKPFDRATLVARLQEAVGAR